jgi:hypothetical protein
MSKYRSSDNSVAGIQRGCYIVILAFNLFFGGWSVNYLLDIFMGKMIPFFWAMVIGLFTGQFSVPVALIVWILKMCKVL